MIINLSDLVPLVTILGAAAAPTLTSIWAAKQANKNAENAAHKVTEVKDTLVQVGSATNGKLDHIEHLVNSQLTEAVGRLDDARRHIIELENRLNQLLENGR